MEQTYKIIVKEYPNSGKVIGGVGRDSTSTELDYIVITQDNHINDMIIPCKYCVIIKGKEVEVKYKYYYKINKHLTENGNIKDLRLSGRVRSVQNDLKEGDIVLVSAIPLHKLEIYFQDAKLNSGKKILKGVVKHVSKNIVGVETDTNIMAIRRDGLKLIERNNKSMSDTFNVFNLV